jgi:hypothetical protein
MIEHTLNALHGSNPLGFLAGLGTLVLASRRAGPEEARLAWHATPSHAARLWCPEPDAAALAAALFAALMDKAGPTPESVTGTSAFKDLTLQLCRSQFDKLASDSAAVLAAMVSDATAKDRPVCGPLVMIGGPQNFTAKVGKLRAAVRAAGPAAIQTALFGPWRYEEGHPLGFDPLMERQHGYLGVKPVPANNRHVPGAVLLAITALELLPLYPVEARGGTANACFRDRQWQAMTWPLWSPPLALRVVESLLSVRRMKSQNALPSEGIFAEFGAERKEVEAGPTSYPILRPGRRIL